MSNQSQASIHESTAWSLPAVSLPASGDPTTTQPIAQCGSGEPRELLCLCVPTPPAPHCPACPSSRHPALHPWEGTRAQAPKSPASGQTPRLRLPHVSMSSLWRLWSTGTTVRTCLLYTAILFGCWKPRIEMTVQNKNQKWVH